MYVYIYVYVCVCVHLHIHMKPRRPLLTHPPPLSRRPRCYKGAPLLLLGSPLPLPEKRRAEEGVMYICIYVYINTYMYMYICVCVFVCVYIYIHIHIYMKPRRPFLTHPPSLSRRPRCYKGAPLRLSGAPLPKKRRAEEGVTRRRRSETRRTRRCWEARSQYSRWRWRERGGWAGGNQPRGGQQPW